MIIMPRTGQSEVKFGSLQNGDVFIYETNFYIKARSFNSSSDNALGIGRMSKGILVNFDVGANVTPLPKATLLPDGVLDSVR